MIVKISSSALFWSVYVQCDDLYFVERLEQLFSSFELSILSNSDKIDANVLTVCVRNCSYSIEGVDNADSVKMDIEWALGMTMELVISPYFLSSNHYLFLHGAAVVKNEKLVLLLAPTQQGKSTTTALMTMSGYEYLSDDVIPIHIEKGMVVSFPRALCIRDMSILKTYKQPLGDFYVEPHFHIKSMDNTTNAVESRCPLIAKNFIKTHCCIPYKNCDVFFWKGTAV